MRRVVHLIGSLNRGGAESVALDLCRSIPSTEVHQTFLCFSGNEGTLASDFRAAGAVVVPIAGPAIARPLRVLTYLKGARPDVFQSHVALASGLFMLIASIAGVRDRIARIHSQGDGQGYGIGRTLYRAASRLLLIAFACEILSVSTAAEDFALGRMKALAKKRPVRVAVVPNGVDTERFRYETPDNRIVPPVVLHVGRPDPAKNRQILPSIAIALNAKVPSEMWIVGPGGTADMEPIVDTPIRALGERDDVNCLMREASALVLPSRREGLPGVVLEALASGLPVVVSDLAGLRELATRLSGVTLIDSRASSEEWADGLVAAINLDDVERSAIRADLAGSNFALEANVESWLALWGA